MYANITCIVCVAAVYSLYSVICALIDKYMCMWSEFFFPTTCKYILRWLDAPWQ